MPRLKWFRRFSGTGPTAVELLDDTVVDLARANTEYRRYVDLMPAPQGVVSKAVLYVEYFADFLRAEIEASFEGRRVSCGAGCGLSKLQYRWRRRSTRGSCETQASRCFTGVPGARKPITFVEDVNAIPVENLATFVKELRQIVAKHGTWGCASTHTLRWVCCTPTADRHSRC